MENQISAESNWQQLTFTKILKDMNEAGQFRASFLVDSQGLTVASVNSAYDIDMASVMTALVKNVVEQARTCIDLAEAVEVNIRAMDNMHLISRYFFLGEEAMILVVLVPPGRSYRHLTNQAIKALKELWIS